MQPTDRLCAAPPPIDGRFDISLNNQQQSVAVDPQEMVRLAEAVLRAEGVTSAEISVALVDDPTIHDLNLQFLQHDYPTDVISFLLSEPDADVRDSLRHIDGEVVISGETARRCAVEFGCEPEHELTLYLVHGLLHLCGYDDQSEAEQQQMRQRERWHLKNAGLTPHYDD